MATVLSVDYVNKRIYLSPDTVGTDLNVMDVYREVRGLRASVDGHRNFRPMVVAGGNIQKTATTYTQPYVLLLNGCKLVPYDLDHVLGVTTEVFTDAGELGAQCFDRSSVGSNVDIDYKVSPVEVRLVAVSGSTLTADEIAAAVKARLLAEPSLALESSVRSTLGAALDAAALAAAGL